MKSIFVIDLETTGLSHYPHSIPIEISIVRILNSKKIKIIFDTFVKWPVEFKDHINNSWWSEMSNIRYEDISDPMPLSTILQTMSIFLKNQCVVSYNTSFDFDRFIYPMMNDYEVEFDWDELKCPMIEATDIVKSEWNEYYQSWKWPTLEEASYYYNINIPKENISFHRSAYDASVTAWLLIEMIKRGDYAV